MRVITGTARGRKLLSPEGTDVRPTSEQVKEAIFSILHFHIPGAKVLDLFCGSGQLGIESLSRGAKSVVFVDRSRTSCKLAETNLEAVGFKGSAKVVCDDALGYLKRCRDTFDIVIADPPYKLGLAAEALPLVSKLVSDGAMVIFETEGKCEMPEAAGELELAKKYRYGHTDLWLYRKAEKCE